MSAVTIESDVTAVVQAAIEKHGKKRDGFIPILTEIFKLESQLLPGQRNKQNTFDCTDHFDILFDSAVAS